MPQQRVSRVLRSLQCLRMIMGEGLATARRDAGADMAITSPEFHQVNGEDACVRWSRAFFISSMR